METKHVTTRFVEMVHSSLQFWPTYIAYYWVIRLLTGPSYVLIYGFMVVLILQRVAFEKIAMIYLLLGIIAYIFGSPVEANHSMSFVYGVMAIQFVYEIYKTYEQTKK